MLQGFAPVEYLHPLPQAAGPKGIGLHEGKHRIFRFGLDNPETAFGHIAGIMTQGAGNENLILVRVHPIDMGLEMLRPKIAVIGQIREKNSKEHDHVPVDTDSKRVFPNR